MRFIGRKDGKLMPGAPGNYVHGKVYSMPFRHSKFKYWELLDAPPELKVPESGDADSVYDEAVFIPWDETSTEEPESEVTLSTPTPVDLDAHTKEIAENYKKQGMYLLDADEGVIVQPDDPVKIDSRSRDDLKKILDDAGVDYNPRLRTETLQKMVEALESEEEP